MTKEQYLKQVKAEAEIKHKMLEKMKKGKKKPKNT